MCTEGGWFWSSFGGRTPSETGLCKIEMNCFVNLQKVSLCFQVWLDLGTHMISLDIVPFFLASIMLSLLTFLSWEQR